MKKVLIITYYWPPAGGPGVQRWLKFVKYLRDFQIEPVVYIPSNPDYPIKDDSLENEVPNGIEILKQRIFEPYFLAKIFSKKQTSAISSGIIKDDNKQGFLQKLLLYIRGNFFIPDARKFWIKPSVKYLSEYIKQHKTDTIITTGPPHSVHLIGLSLKEKLQVKWIADFRDPWTGIGYHKKLKLSETSEAKHIQLEAEVLQKASHIITTSFTTKAEFELITRVPITVITNGFDIDRPTSQVLDKTFTISHIGSLLSGRNPQNLWNVLHELVEENPDFANDLRLKLVGAVSEEVLDSIKNSGLEKNLDQIGYVAHREALMLQNRAQVLLLIEIDSVETRGIIPGKLFEYLASKRPILALGPEKWDVERILYETGSGNFFNYSAKDELKYRIMAYYKLYKQDLLSSESKNIEKYSRRSLTGKLADLLKH
ncbi:glycosyltransferase family 4 protein [Antarcticibacterium arcticum]|uniref:Glycosyltransferase family 4 protein n=1 Tax=Antarcticibacterium arcticum TaxID=2585771 RepID=A0A5B8YIH9_9FLAO|nr:glycosyltransferase [Antarcticibacterium arcticum]QED36848.1 glycosyltransferase family 4 protein [Antarcticibacterium arcticum]